MARPLTVLILVYLYKHIGVLNTAWAPIYGYIRYDVPT